MYKIVELVNSSKNIAIFAHIKTDCDAVCSSLALKLALKQLGKNADIYIDSCFSNQIESLTHFNTINNAKLQKYDCYFCLDTATIDRLGKYKYKIMKNRQISCQLDHHATNEKYCKYNYINEKYSSTCELLYTFFKFLNIKITSEMAYLMLTGVLTDTGKLSFSNTTKDTLFVASKLLELADTTMDKVCEPIFSSKTLPEFNLTKFVYNNLQLTADNQIAYIVIDSADFKKCGASFDDTHGLCEIGTSIASVKVMILASQDPVQENCYHISVRSKGGVSARQICTDFGGGGHINAAGCKIFDTKENIINNLLNSAKKEIKC